jgi:hypothetical protein
MGIAVLVAIFTASEAQCGPTHPFLTPDSGLPGLTRVLGGTSDYPVLLYATGSVKGFAKDAAVQLQVNRTDAGEFEGFFNAFRDHGSKRANNGGGEHLTGTVSGTAYDFGDGIMYIGVATITAGTGRLEGATGTILIMITQYGYQDPNIILVDREADFIYDGEYTIP